MSHSVRIKIPGSRTNGKISIASGHELAWLSYNIYLPKYPDAQEQAYDLAQNTKPPVLMNLQKLSHALKTNGRQAETRLRGI